MPSGFPSDAHDKHRRAFAASVSLTVPSPSNHFIILGNRATHARAYSQTVLNTHLFLFIRHLRLVFCCFPRAASRPPGESAVTQTPSAHLIDRLLLAKAKSRRVVRWRLPLRLQSRVCLHLAQPIISHTCLKYKHKQLKTYCIGKRDFMQ